jgi:hypothetical protein
LTISTPPCSRWIAKSNAENRDLSIPIERSCGLLTINTQGISGRALLNQDLDEVDFSRFVERLKSKTEAEVKKKERITLENLHDVIGRLLWDFPHEERNINPYSIPVLRRRLNRLPLPSRSVLERQLKHTG